MEIYQRLGEALSNEEVDEIFFELVDRFGKVPPPATRLYYLTRIRIFAATHDFNQLLLTRGNLIAEKKGKKDKTITKKIAFQPPKQAKVLEERVIETLKSHFKIK